MIKTALITGASGGLGSCIAKVFAKNGIRVFLTGRRSSNLKKLSLEIGDMCEGYLVADLTNASEIRKLVEYTMPNILVNCAGLFPVSSLEETSLKDFDECFSVNVRAPFLLTKYIIPHMRNLGWGRIINIGSSSSYGGFPNTSTYCSSKHALLGLSRSMFHELKNDNIRTYCISPGSIKTDMGKNVVGQKFDTFMEPDEIARFILEIIQYNGNMISEEVRLNRMFVQ